MKNKEEITLGFALLALLASAYFHSSALAFTACVSLTYFVFSKLLIEAATSKYVVTPKELEPLKLKIDALEKKQQEILDKVEALNLKSSLRL